MAIAAGKFHYKTKKLTIEDVTIFSPLLIDKKLEDSNNIKSQRKLYSTWEIHSLDDRAMAIT